jgi:hypothetical protein
MSNISSEILVVSTLPTPLPSNGLFNVTQNITAGTFNDPSVNVTSSTYSNWLLNPADLIGTPSAPYAPVALPAYVSTLYQNVYNINNSLQDDISAPAQDDRDFPTSYAVQKYVQSQLSGCQVLNKNDPSNNGVVVSTSLTNTLIELVTGNSFRYTYIYQPPSGGPAGTANVSIFQMDISLNPTRNGASKIVIYGDSEFATTSNGNVTFLYSGDESAFIVAGQRQLYYQFTFVGDFVQFVTVYDTTTASWLWLVTGYQSVFSNSINIPNITAISGAPPL